ncbi:MAG: zinc ribbon domain-containing protein [Bacteroidota bacterium]
MENRLRQLYTLQLVDSNLDELEELKGDLPRIVRSLEAKKAELQARISTLEHTMRSAFSERDNADSEIISLKEKVTKYKAQQLQVRNNKEYDALTREIDHATDTASQLEKNMGSLETKATIARTGIEEAKKELDDLEKVLEEKAADLAEVSKTTADEEAKYHHEREKIIVRISKADIEVYERIRKARRGKAVVPIKRGSCGGCFNKVPPQELLELRQNKKVYLCEHCGRIIISDAVAETIPAVV